MIKRLLVLSLSLAAGLFMLDAQNVDKDELSSVGAATIEFINYSGPHELIETAASIRGIGQALGAAVAGGSARYGDASKYYIIHAVDSSVKEGFDADILILGEGCGLDHIKNLRRIIAGYLESAYKYSAKDADTLAVFITVYNAVYRGKLDYFKGKYKPVVLKELIEATAGLSIRWDEWAGCSRIVIPLSARAGAGVVGSVNTTPITDKPTIDSVKKDSPTGGVEERRDVVDIKERDVAQEENAIAKEKARIAEEERKLAEEKARLAAVNPADPAAASGTAADGAKDAAASAEKGGTQQAGISETPAAKAEADKEAAAAVAAKEAALTAAKTDVAARETAVAAKKDEIAADRVAVATDQKGQIGSEVAAAAAKEASGVVLFELLNPGLPYARIVLVDIKTSERLRKSDVNQIRTPSIVDMGDAYIAVAGQVTGTGGLVRLIRVEKSDYSKTVQSSVDVFPESTVWNISNAIYAVIKAKDGWALGLFDPKTLELKAASAAVSQWTFLTESAGMLIVQKPSGGFNILEKGGLKTSSEIAP